MASPKPTAPHGPIQRRGLQLEEPSALAALQSASKTTRLAIFYDSQAFWLLLYFWLNLLLTLSNKAVLGQFPFPYVLTAIHSLFGSVGGELMIRADLFVPASLNAIETTILAAFSVLYSVNIAISNVSLQLVSVPFHQVVRATAPLFTIGFAAILLGTYCTSAQVVSLIPVMAGVALATYGDYTYTRTGLALTLLGAILAALKGVLTNMLQAPSTRVRRARLRLHPLDLLRRMAPLAFIQCVAFAAARGELARIAATPHVPFTALVANGALACALNAVSFTANRRAGALSMAVAANVKQVLTILAAVVLFDVPVTYAHALGISLTLAGGAWYARAEFIARHQ